MLKADVGAARGGGGTFATATVDAFTASCCMSVLSRGAFVQTRVNSVIDLSIPCSRGCSTNST